MAADDDTNVPLAMLSALYDHTYTEDITAEQIGRTLLNQAPYEHGFFWWGGYGVSTEHTAYINLLEGIPAPFSGSVEHNGKAVAEQIGGQIFIDPWGLICPNDPDKASRYAAKAASVTHGGNGVYGGMFVAAAIAAAFGEKDIRIVIERALQTIPSDCEYVRMARDIISFYDNDSAHDWETAFKHIQDNWGYNRYPGACHIIPNAAVMIMSMLCGEGDFSQTICICNMCGWDTDCNVGNVGTIMGVLVGVDGIEEKWRLPVNDAFVLSTVIGSRNSLDIPWCVSYIATLGYRIAGLEIPERWVPFIKPQGLHCHFELPGSTHGFFAKKQKGREVKLQQAYGDAASGEGFLKVTGFPDQSAPVAIARKTYFRVDDFDDSRYDPDFSPTVYPGQVVSAKLKAVSGQYKAALFAYDFNQNETYFGPDTLVGNSWTDLSFALPAGIPGCIDEVGVKIWPVEIGDGSSENGVLVDDFAVSGDASYKIDFSKERYDFWHYHHFSVSQFTVLRGIWTLYNQTLNGSGPAFAQAYTGNVEWSGIDFTATIIPRYMQAKSRAGIGFRIQGAMRSYCAGLEDGFLKLFKNEYGVWKVLAETPFEYSVGQAIRIQVKCVGSEMKVFGEDSAELLSFNDTDNPYLTGCIGAILANGASASYSDWVIKTFV
jgi:ADP-ribosylglycohydrolase